MGEAREFLELWMQNSVHAAEQPGVRGASQRPEDLKARCIEMAAPQGLSQADLEAEVGDLYQYIKAAGAAANDEAVTHEVRWSDVAQGRKVGRHEVHLGHHRKMDRSQRIPNRGNGEPRDGAGH
jgi:hypothetical protein